MDKSVDKTHFSMVVFGTVVIYQWRMKTIDIIAFIDFLQQKAVKKLSTYEDIEVECLLSTVGYRLTYYSEKNGILVPLFHSLKNFFRGYRLSIINHIQPEI